jgi:hypothetical protein
MPYRIRFTVFFFAFFFFAMFTSFQRQDMACKRYRFRLFLAGLTVVLGDLRIGLVLAFVFLGMFVSARESQSGNAGSRELSIFFSWDL